MEKMLFQVMQSTDTTTTTTTQQQQKQQQQHTTIFTKLRDLLSTWKASKLMESGFFQCRVLCLKFFSMVTLELHFLSIIILVNPITISLWSLELHKFIFVFLIALHSGNSIART
ncbi:hypothetical protein QYF36_009120 [Acer negundo]|nr:hypothetical protein QYF36_009120 [Acer negundo]